MAKRNCDGDCLHSKECDSDYQDQIEEEKAEKTVCGDKWGVHLSCILKSGHSQHIQHTDGRVYW